MRYYRTTPMRLDTKNEVDADADVDNVDGNLDDDDDMSLIETEANVKDEP